MKPKTRKTDSNTKCCINCVQWTRLHNNIVFIVRGKCSILKKVTSPNNVCDEFYMKRDLF